MDTSSAVNASRSLTWCAPNDDSGADLVLTQRRFELGLVVAFAGRTLLDDQSARQEELAAGELSASRRPHDDAPRWHHPPAELLARGGVDHGDAGVEDDTLGQDGPLTHPGPL